MKRFVAALFLLVAIAGLCAAATNDYVVIRKSTTASTEKITVHLPTGSSASTVLDAVTVYCSAECEAVQERDGTAPTTTSLTVTKVNSAAATAKTQAFRSSNVGSGTEIGRDVVPAGQTFVLDLKDKGLLPGENYTITPTFTTGSGTIKVVIKFREYQF